MFSAKTAPKPEPRRELWQFSRIWTNHRHEKVTKYRYRQGMSYSYAKKEARRERYQARARKARFYARLVILMLVGTAGAAAWQDDTYGPQMKQYALVAMEKFEAATDEDSAGRKLVQAAMSKLQL